LKEGMKKFKFLDHMGDALIEAYGKSLEEAFENAALAMFEIMTDTRKVRSLLEREIEVTSEDKEGLLYSWLENLLIEFEVSNVLFSKFKVKEISRTKEGYSLIGIAWGEEFDPEKHTSKVGIKAVTYHLMRIIENKEVKVRVLFDL
jgi:SHS2 domain-containing protein